MARIFLQDMVDDVPFDGLPVNWNAFDLGIFSRTKTLWDYQQKAVENAIKALWKYYEDFGDYQASENAEANRERRQRLFKWYLDNGLDEALDIPLTGNHKLASLLSEYYTVEDEKIPYDQFINRACFWMATGSGKTLVLVKLIEVLRGLILRGEIPPHDILVLSCRDDLIEQLKKHVHEFNMARSDLFIHFKNIKVSLEDISDLRGKVESVRQFEDPEAIKKQLRERLERKEIDLDEYTAGVERAARMVREAQAEYYGKRLKIRHVANHYYIPMILSGETERIDYIKHIIQTESEIKLLNRLEDYLAKPNHKFHNFDWWMFSKLDESLDEVYVPYYDGSSNKVRKFKPDFIFWLQKGNDYFVVFIDPKGTEHTDYQRKIDGYAEVFEHSGCPKTTAHEGKKVKVFAFLHTDNVDGLPKPYKRYWFDDIDKALAYVVNAA